MCPRRTILVDSRSGEDILFVIHRLVLPPSMTLFAGCVEDDGSTGLQRPLKRRRTLATDHRPLDGSKGGDVVRRHPLGVRPSGNAITASTNAKDSCGFFARLPDEIIVLLLEVLQVPHVLKLGATCRALHAFTRNEELWRALFVE